MVAETETVTQKTFPHQVLKRAITENASNQTAADAGLAIFAAIKTKAEQGDALAEFNLGTIYAEGRFVPQDYAAALMWFSKSAQNGNHEADCVLNGFRELVETTDIKINSS